MRLNLIIRDGEIILILEGSNLEIVVIGKVYTVYKYDYTKAEIPRESVESFNTLADAIECIIREN